jgi:hypothetical protein
MNHSRACLREGKEYSSDKRGREDKSAVVPKSTFDALIAELNRAGGYVEAYGYGASCSDEVEAIRNACGDQRGYKRLQGMLDAGMHGEVLRKTLSEIARDVRSGPRALTAF